jgi:hypothetical protein
MKFRTSLVAATAALSAAALAATPAAAQVYDVDAYVFVNAGIHSNGAITLLGQTVTWSINLNAFVCAAVSLDNNDPIIPEVAVCAGVGTGTYTQIACGTGSVVGTLSASSAGDTDSIAFTAQIVSGLAVLSGSTASGARVVGVAQLLPAAGQSCVTGMTDLTATGALAVVNP